MIAEAFVTRLARSLLNVARAHILSPFNAIPTTRYKGTDMKKTMLAAAIFAAFAGSAFAQTAAPAAPAATPEHTLTGNITLATDYRFRGLSQTFKGPAIQGGFDYAHSSGLYVGNWNSNVSSLQYTNGSGIEMDLYGGYKWELVKGVNADVGLLYYYYPNAEYAGSNKKFNNGEIYFGVTWEWLSAKYNYGLTDFFGLNSTTAPAGLANGDSKGSGYLDITANYEFMPKTFAIAHVGRQWVKNYGALNYTDYKLGVARDLGFATVGLSYYKANAPAAYNTITNGNGSSKNIADGSFVLSVSKTF